MILEREDANGQAGFFPRPLFVINSECEAMRMRMCFISIAAACTAVDEGGVGLVSAPRS